MGFFGLSYYEKNRDRLNLVAIDQGSGCIEPNVNSVAQGTYQPLSRPLFLYLNKTSLAEKAAFREFVSFYLAQAAILSEDTGYIPLTAQLYDLAKSRFAAGTEGSVFKGSSSVGSSLEDLLARER